MVHARSISQRGITVLAPCSILPGTACDIYHIDTAGAWQVCPGQVAGCEQLTDYSQIWDIRVGLASALDVVRYAPSAWRAKILVVDDSPTIRHIMKRFLPDYHADAVCVQNGQEALEQGLNNYFDLIILDVEMPGQSGIEIAQALRERGCIQPIVIMTATSERENRAACMAAGCDSFVSKPIKSEELSELIRMVKPPPLISALDDDPESHALVDGYVEQIGATIDQLTAAYAAGDCQKLSMLSRHICAEAPACGFPSLAKLAARVVDAVETGFPIADVRRPLGELLRNLRAARPARNLEPICTPEALASAPGKQR